MCESGRCLRTSELLLLNKSEKKSATAKLPFANNGTLYYSKQNKHFSRLSLRIANYACNFFPLDFFVFVRKENKFKYK